MSRIFIIGAGLVGLATGRALRATGHQVTFIDTDSRRIADLTQQGLDARPELDLRGEGESFIVVTLPTPPATGRQAPGYDLAILREGVRSIGRALAASETRHIVVMRSTVLPRTTDGVVRHLLERVSGKRAGTGFHLVAHPEFFRPGHADHDAQWPVLTVIGGQDHRVADRVARELAPFGGVRHIVSSAAAAEMIKCVHVLQRTVAGAFRNEVANIAQRLGLETDQITRALASDHDLWLMPDSMGEFGSPGPDAYEFKDAEAFLATAAETGVPAPLLGAAVATSAHERQLQARRSVRSVPRRREEGARLISLDPLTAAVPNGQS